MTDKDEKIWMCRRCKKNPAFRNRRGALCWRCIKNEGMQTGYGIMDKIHASVSELRYSFEKER